MLVTRAPDRKRRKRLENALCDETRACNVTHIHIDTSFSTDPLRVVSFRITRSLPTRSSLVIGFFFFFTSNWFRTSAYRGQDVLDFSIIRPPNGYGHERKRYESPRTISYRFQLHPTRLRNVWQLVLIFDTVGSRSKSTAANTFA